MNLSFLDPISPSTTIITTCFPSPPRVREKFVKIVMKEGKGSLLHERFLLMESENNNLLKKSNHRRNFIDILKHIESLKEGTSRTKRTKKSILSEDKNGE